MLRVRHRLAVDNAATSGMLWHVPGPPPDSQLVTLAPGRAFEEPWLVLRADVLPLPRLDPLRALRHSARMAIGALCVVGDRYVVRHSCALDGVTLEDLGRMLPLLAAEAIRLRRGCADSAELSRTLFVPYCD